ncbi:MAG: type II/IV secretion system protein, partial [Betaproteobacteria bacterium]
MATPLTGSPPSVGSARPAQGTPTRAPDRRLRLEDILKLMVADGLVAPADADTLARSRTRRFEHPLEMIADRKWKSLAPPYKGITLDWLVEWLGARLGVPSRHIDPLKIDLGAVTQTMSNAYAERYCVLPIEVTRETLTVGTAEPFVRAWADELEQILRLKVEFVFVNPVDIRR